MKLQWVCLLFASVCIAAIKANNRYRLREFSEKHKAHLEKIKSDPLPSDDDNEIESEGCDIDGEHYEPGEVIPSDDPCEKCTCPTVGTIPRCIDQSHLCPTPTCIDPESSEGECCDGCPNGELSNSILVHSLHYMALTTFH